MIIHRLLKLDVIDRIAISHEDIQKYYKQHHDRFVKPEEVRVRQIVTRTKDEAEQLRKKILRGASFEETAKKHSLGPEAVKGGDLGYFPRGRMPPEIDEVCFKLWAGSRASKSIESPYGFHLFKLVDKRPARELSLSTAKAEIEVPNPNLNLRPGMFANVSVVIEEKFSVPVIPKYTIIEKTSLNYEAGQLTTTKVKVNRHVFVIEDSIAVKREITIGIEDRTRAEVVTGLNGAEKIVLVGQHNLTDSARVDIITAVE